MIQKVKQWKSGVQFEILEYQTGVIWKVKRNKDDILFIRNTSVFYKDQKHRVHMFHDNCVDVFVVPEENRQEYGIELSISDDNEVTSKTVKIEKKTEDMQNKLVPINELILVEFNFIFDLQDSKTSEDIQ